MMKIANIIKFTSLAVLGTWMLVAPSSNAFAANQQVEDEVHKRVNSIMQKTTDSTGAKKLKNEELAIKRGELTSKVNELKAEYKKNITSIESYQKQLKGIVEKAHEIEEEISTFVWTGVASGLIVLATGALLALGTVTTGGILPILIGIIGAAGSYYGYQAENDPEKLRSMVNGSYTWATKQLMEKTVQIDLTKITNIDLSQVTDPKQKSQLQSVMAKTSGIVAEYNSIATKLNTLAQSALKSAMDLDQKIDELNSMPLTIGAGQELYTYQVWGKDTQGKPVLLSEFYFVMDKDGSLNSIGGVSRGCIPLPAKLAEAQSCIYCPLFKTIFNAAQSMSTKSYDKLASPIANILLIGFALIIAFMVLKSVSSFTKQDAPKFITELLVNMFKVLVAYYMLKNSSVVYGYIIGPVLKAGFEFGSSLLFATDNNYLSSCAAMKLPANPMPGVMPAYLYTNLDCFIRAVQAEVAVPQSIGSSLMCIARNAGKVSIGPLRNVMWDFGMMFQGFAIWVMGWIISLAFAFYLIDATIQLGILGALMPFLIACWPFKVTNSYTKKGWGMFMNTFFVYVFMGLVVSINVELLGQGLTGASGGFDAVEDAINGNDISTLRDLLDIGFAGFLVLVACCLFAFKLTGQASSLAGTMAGGGGPSIGANIGGLAYGTATKGVQGTLKTGLKAGKAFSDKTGLTGLYNKGKDAVWNGALSMIGLGRKSGAAGNKAAQNSFKKSQTAPDGSTPTNNNLNPSVPNNSTPNNQPGNNPVAQNQLKKMSQVGSRAQTPATPKPDTPNAQTQNSGTTPQASTQPKPADDAQLRQQLEQAYQNTDNGKAGQQMIDNQAADVAQKKKVEAEALGKMNYHNRRADEYLKKSQTATDSAQKKNFENLANAQFEEAVKAEAAYNKAKADTLKSQNELNAIKQENERAKNEFVQQELNKRTQPK